MYIVPTKSLMDVDVMSVSLPYFFDRPKSITLISSCLLLLPQSSLGPFANMTFSYCVVVAEQGVIGSAGCGWDVWDENRKGGMRTSVFDDVVFAWSAGGGKTTRRRIII